MNAYDRLRAVLEDKAVNAGIAAGIKIRLPNESANQPTGETYGEFWHKFTPAPPRPSLGGGRKHFKCRSGMFQFTLYCPEKTGNGPITRAGDIIEKFFSAQQYKVAPDGYVTLDDIAVDPIPKPVNGQYSVLVWTTFDFHYRDPDAVEPTFG